MTLDPDRTHRERMGRQALDTVLGIFDRAAEPPVYPRVSADDLHARLAEPLPRAGTPAEDVLRAVREHIATACRNNNHPRMFGYVNSPASFTGVLGDFIASALNQNVTSWRSAPGATTVERQVVEWLRELVGFASGASGLLVSGGSMANLTAMLVALRALGGRDINERGVAGLGPVAIYVSPMVHMSVGKAAEVVGLGRRACRTVPMTRDLTMDPVALREALARDRRDGVRPVAVAASAGDVNAGIVDPIDAMADVCADFGAWLHVDGSYGALAARAPSAAALFGGLARADSLALDPHKWLYAPIDVGCLLVREPARLRGAFSAADDYVSVLGAPSDFAFWDHGIELSRRFRALKVWMMLKHHGADAILAAIDENIRLAHRLAALVDEAEDFERLAPAPLSMVCFRHVPASWREPLASGDPGERQHAERALDALNRAITVEVQRGGHEVYFSNATIGGRFALRACLTSFRTRETDLGILLDTVRRVAATVARVGGPGAARHPAPQAVRRRGLVLFRSRN